MSRRSPHTPFGEAILYDGPERPEWMSHPRRHCAGFDLELFFPESDCTNYHEAAKICKGCPVLDECLDWAVEHRESGVWAATTERQRATIRRQRRREVA